MKYARALNLFWAIVWGIVLIAAFASIFYKPALYVVIGIGGGFFTMFLIEYIRIIRMK